MSPQPCAARSLKSARQVGRGREVAAGEHFDERLDVAADDHERGGFERLDEAAGIADGDDILHPLPPVAAGAEFHDARRLRRFGILAQEFGGGFVVGDGLRGIDVAAIDVMLVLDLPAQPAVHRLGGGVGQDRLVRAIPAADDGAVAEEGAVEADERLGERLAEQFAAEAAGSR